jgi:ABC-2 type transport system permease protein
MTSTTIDAVTAATDRTVPSVRAAVTPPSALATARTIAARTVRKFVRTPQLVVVTAVTAAMFLLMFLYVFGGAMSAGAVSYLDFLVPGFLVANMIFAAMNASAAVAEDLEQGLFDRLRSLPVSRTALLTGRVLADTVLLSWGMVVVGITALLVGFRAPGDFGHVVLAVGLTLFFGFAFTWVAVVMGLVAGNAQAAQGMSMIGFPLVFLSSAYVPVDTMPGWLQPIVEHQPVTVMANAVRSLMLGDPALAGVTTSTSSSVLLSVLWAAGIIIVFASLAVAKFRRS